MKKMRMIFIVDESGSMDPQQDTVISGFNEQLQSMAVEEKEQDIQYLVTLTKFSDKITKLFTDVPLSQVKPLTKETYKPGGFTRLLDAVGETISVAEPNQTDTCVVIFTDGQENASKNWKRNTTKVLIDLRQSENRWGFIFFGANQDSWQEASSLGITNAVNYTTANTGAAIYAMNAVRSCYVSTATSGEYNISNSSLTSTINTADLVK